MSISSEIDPVRYEFSILNLYKFGIGPSSSHTIAPMLAASNFCLTIMNAGLLHRVSSVTISLRGSMSQVSGKGHKTPRAILLGLEMFEPSKIGREQIDEVYRRICDTHQLNFAGTTPVSFDFDHDIRGNPQPTNEHYNASMIFQTYDDSNQLVFEKEYYSIGGGYISSPDDGCAVGGDPIVQADRHDRLIVHSATDVFGAIREGPLDVIAWVRTYEQRFGIFRTEDQIARHLDLVIETMSGDITLGRSNTLKHLEGYMTYPVVAPELFQNLERLRSLGREGTMEYDLSLLQAGAIAVSEINAVGYDRMVTAPTCGACGVIPSLVNYLIEKYHATTEQLRNFLTVAALIGTLARLNASISGSDVGCQGEIGVATAMGAGAMCWFLGGTIGQIEAGASHALQQFLGMTCDPIAGYVQIPCINRNAFGATTAVGSAILAINTPLSQLGYVRYDAVIEAVKRSGYYMPTDLKETSRDGLARTVKKANLRAKLIGKEIT